MKIMTRNEGRDPVPGCDIPQTLQEKQRSLQSSLCCQIIILLLKIFTTVLGGSLTQISDLFRSCADILSIIFSIGSLKKTSRGKNDIYQYGYGKLESLASLIVALVILISCFIILLGMVLRLQHPSPVGSVGYGVLVSIFSIGVNGYFLHCNHQISKKGHSPVMESQWRLFRVKVFANVSVIVILILSILFRSNPHVLYIDLIGSAIVCCFMLSTAYHLLISSVYELIDGALEETLQLQILQELAGNFHQYQQFHGLKSRRSGTEVFIIIFLEFSHEQNMGEVQSVIDRMSASMESKIQNSHVYIVPATSKMQ